MTDRNSQLPRLGRVMNKLSAALRSVRDDLAGLLEPAELAEHCRSAGLTWRERLLDPVTTIHLFLLQILHGNVSCPHLARLAGMAFSASAYCQARARLPLGVLNSLARRIADALVPDADREGLWHGHRTWLADGTGVSMPDTPGLKATFGQPPGQRVGCGFPVAKLLALFHHGTGMLRELIVSPLATHDLSATPRVHPAMREGDVLVGDRAFGTFAHLALLAGRGLHGVFRLHHRRSVDFDPDRESPERWDNKSLRGRPRSRLVRSLGEEDQVVDWYKPYNYARPDWLSPEEYDALPVTLRVRETRYRVERPGFRVREITLVSTLLDAGAYPADSLAHLYGCRWEVETNLRHLKTTMGMDVLKCQSEAGVLRELAVYAAAYNLVRAVMLEAARRQGVCPGRVSFADALRWLANAGPRSSLPRLVVNPDRPDRVEPRCQKRRGKNYPYMIHPRDELRRRIIIGESTQAA